MCRMDCTNSVPGLSVVRRRCADLPTDLRLNRRHELVKLFRTTYQVKQGHCFARHIR